MQYDAEDADVEDEFDEEYLDDIIFLGSHSDFDGGFEPPAEVDSGVDIWNAQRENDTRPIF